MALTDALGNLVRFVLLPGQRHDSVGTEPLIKDIDLPHSSPTKLSIATACGPR
jgi:hypothetical protein